MKTENFHFTQQQQNILGEALKSFATDYSGDGESPAARGAHNLSSLLEDFLNRDCDVVDMGQVQISTHSHTVRGLRELLRGIFDHRVLPALENTTKLEKAA